MPTAFGHQPARLAGLSQLSTQCVARAIARTAVYVTGFVTKPGSYNLSSLATAGQALFKAGGPSATGSFRNIEIKRGNQRIGTLDLYDLLVSGDRSSDRISLQPDDVIHVGPVGTQVGLIGSVNRPAVFELKAGRDSGRPCCAWRVGSAPSRPFPLIGRAPGRPRHGADRATGPAANMAPH
jgi:protein involved in polysaccharide export with SLBB domain